MRKLIALLCFGTLTLSFVWANPIIQKSINSLPKFHLLQNTITSAPKCVMCTGIATYSHQILQDRPIFQKSLKGANDNLQMMKYLMRQNADASFVNYYFGWKGNIMTEVNPGQIDEAKKFDDLVMSKMKQMKTNYAFVGLRFNGDRSKVSYHMVMAISSDNKVYYIDAMQGRKLRYSKGSLNYLANYDFIKKMRLESVFAETSHLKIPAGHILHQGSTESSNSSQLFKKINLKTASRWGGHGKIFFGSYRTYNDDFILKPSQNSRELKFSGRQNRFSRWKKQLSVIPKDDIKLIDVSKTLERSTDALSSPSLSAKLHTSFPKMGASVGNNLKGLKALKAVRLSAKSARFLSKVVGPADAFSFAIETGFYAMDMANISRRDDLSSSQKAIRYTDKSLQWLNQVVSLFDLLIPDDSDKKAYDALSGVQSTALADLKKNGYDYSILETKLNDDAVLTALRDAEMDEDALLIDSHGKSSEEASRHLAWVTRLGLIDQAAVVADTAYLNLNYQMYQKHERLFPALSLLAKAYEQDMFNTIKAGLSGISQQVAYCVFNAILIVNGDIEEPRDFRKSCGSGFSDSELRTALLAMFTSSKRQELLNLHAEYLQQRKELLDQVYPDEVAEFYTKTADGVLQNIDSDGVHKAYQEAYETSGYEIFKARLWSGLAIGKKWEEYDCRSRGAQSIASGEDVICDYREVDRELPEVSASDYDASLDDAVKTQYNDDFSGLKSEIRRFLNDHYIPYLTRQNLTLNAGLSEFPEWYNQEVSEYTVSQPIEWDCQQWKSSSQLSGGFSGTPCTPSKYHDTKYFSLSSTKNPVFSADFQGLWLEKYLTTLLENKENYDEYEFASMTGDPKFFETYLKPQIDDECFGEDKCLSKLAQHVFEMEEDAKYSNDFFYTSFRNYYVWKNYGNHLYPRDAYDLPYLKIRSVADQSQCVDASFAVVDCMSGNTRFLYKMVGNKVQIQHPQGGCVLVESDALKQGSCESQKGWSNAGSGASYEGNVLSDAVSLSLQGSTLLTAIPSFSTAEDGLVKLGDSTDALSSLLQSLLYQAKHLPDTVKRLNLVSKLTNSQQLAFASGKCVNADLNDLSVSLATCASSSTQWWHGPDQLLKVKHLQNQKPEYCLSNTNNSLSLKECQ